MSQILHKASEEFALLLVGLQAILFGPFQHKPLKLFPQSTAGYNDINISFTTRKLECSSVPHNHFISFRNNWCSGTKSGGNFTKYWTIPMKARNYVTSSSFGISVMALTFSEDWCHPSAEMTCPKYSTKLLRNLHFSWLAFKPYSLGLFNTSRSSFSPKVQLATMISTFLSPPGN